MSLLQHRKEELWKDFRLRVYHIDNRVSSDFISLQKYPESYFENFDAGRIFEKWATVEVSDFERIPEEMEVLTVPEGHYAMFNYKGRGGDPRIFQYIFSEWLPKSSYRLDNRPHFEVLGETYGKDDPNAREKIFIPVTWT